MITKIVKIHGDLRERGSENVNIKKDVCDFK
jgi:hypothetical protein